ncbi:MAG: MFS transporter, partial [Albidovulum sp.]
MKPSAALDSAASWTRLAISLLVAVVGNVGMWAVILILPSVQAEFGIDRAGASLPYTATMAGFALGNFAIGRAVDRWGMAWALIGAAVLNAAAYAAA